LSDSYSLSRSSRRASWVSSMSILSGVFILGFRGVWVVGRWLAFFG
jgi:hypothetical protein